MKTAHSQQLMERHRVRDDREPRQTMSFDEIADLISRAEGRRISRQAIAAQHQKALKKLRNAIEEDPRLHHEFLQAI